MTKMRKTLFWIWLGSIAMVVADWQITSILDSRGLTAGPLEAIGVVAWIVALVLSFYWVALVARYLLRKLFWRVGRRLLLSYVFVGALPFLFFAILLLVMGYLMGGALSRAAVRSERQSTLVRMDRWNLEYSLSGKLPGDSNLVVEVYDTDKPVKKDLPAWLRERSFSGLASRGSDAVFVSSRVYVTNGKPRTISLVMPVDEKWGADVRDRSGMSVASFVSWSGEDEPADGQKKKHGISVDVNGKRTQYKSTSRGPGIEDLLEKDFNPMMVFRGTILWGDRSSALVEWDSGQTNEEKTLLTLVANPISNLRDTYFGGQEYASMLIRGTTGIAMSLFVVYGFAALFAGVLIFSISRAVNRIEKGTKAVEKGDFSYRIRMKPHNQLGEVAQSFDRMTESIASLLHRVAEQERLQSEVDIAASIQRNLLPKDGPTLKGVSFAAHFEPSAAIGGDYYDVFSLDRGRLAVAIGDVSGHGLSTGLVMAMVKAAMTTLVEEGATEGSLFKRLNDLVFRSTDKRAFMTLGFTIYDVERKTIRHTNAGHLYPYLLRIGSAPIPIEAPSLPLGVRQDIEPHTTELSLEEGDTIVYLSDGIIEAQNENHEPYGFEATESLLNGLVGSSPAQIQESILSEIAKHSGEKCADDDRTVMIIRFDELEGMHTRAEVLAEAGA